MKRRGELKHQAYDPYHLDKSYEPFPKIYNSLNNSKELIKVVPEWYGGRQ